MSGEGNAARKLVTNERTKLTATYLNTAAGGLFTAGVVAPLVAAVFGLGTSPHLSALTLVLGIAIFLGTSGSLTSRGSHGPERAKAMTDIQIVAFIVAPVMAVAFGWGVALLARRAA